MLLNKIFNPIPIKVKIIDKSDILEIIFTFFIFLVTKCKIRGKMVTTIGPKRIMYNPSFSP